MKKLFNIRLSTNITADLDRMKQLPDELHPSFHVHGMGMRDLHPRSHVGQFSPNTEFYMRCCLSNGRKMLIRNWPGLDKRSLW